MNTSLRLSRRPLTLWASWVVAALLLLTVATGWAYAVLVAASALLVATLPGALPARGTAPHGGNRDLVAVAALYLGVVALLRLAFVVFTTDRIPGLFVTFAAALLLGVVGPVVYTVWLRGGSLADLGLRLDNWRTALALGLLFGAVQFALTLWGYDLPAPVDWVPLLVMALTVGVFESVFFRGFIQNRLEERLGPVFGIAGAAFLYGLYHVGYGMGLGEIAFLTGLGLVYAVAFATVRNVLVLWPLLTPLGSFFANLEGGDIELPWAAIAGFCDVLAVMAVALWVAHRRERRHAGVESAGASLG